MNTIFDCIYLISCDVYKSREREIFKASGLILMSGLIAFNLMLIAFLLEPHYDGGLGEDFIYAASLLIVGTYLLVLLPSLYIRYFRLTNYEKIKSNINGLTSGKKITYLLIAYGYIFISVIGFFSFIFYKGGTVNGWW